MRKYVGTAPAGIKYFDGACEAIQKVGPGAFMLSPGDCDPPGPIRAALDTYLGTNYLWYPAVGNHDTEYQTNMAWLRCWAEKGIPNLCRKGPPGAELTIYSFDYGNSHFVVLNNYFDGTSDVVKKDELPEALFEWVEKDLKATDKPLVWVAGHKPLKSFPDMDSGRIRHANESITTNTVQFVRFIDLLKQNRVRA